MQHRIINFLQDVTQFMYLGDATTLKTLATELNLAPLDWHSPGDLMQVEPDETIVLGGEPGEGELAFICAAIAVLTSARMIVLSETMSQFALDGLKQFPKIPLMTIEAARAELAH